LNEIWGLKQFKMGHVIGSKRKGTYIDKIFNAKPIKDYAAHLSLILPPTRKFVIRPILMEMS
jgi:hypothetical protein